MSVHLVGAGPGDPGLITARGLELVRGCDVLVYDRLVAPELVAEAPEDALLVARDGLVQEDVNRLLVELGRDRSVVRLKGGDPFVFGRGGEEALALAEADVPYEVVPGVSALAAVPAAAGIPLTHRGVAAEVRVVTGRSAPAPAPAKPAPALPAGSVEPTPVTTGPPTIVVFMGLETATEVRDRLLAEGLGGETPVAIVSRGTRPDQEVVVTEVARLPEAAAEVEAPALLVVGAVVALRERLRATELAR